MLTKKLGVCITYKNDMINVFFFLPVSCLTIFRTILPKVNTNVFYAVSEKYLLKCVFVYYFISPNVRFFRCKLVIFLHRYDNVYRLIAQRVECSLMIQKTLKMVFDTSLLNTQPYKVRIEGKVEQSRERNSVLPYTSV